MGPRVKPGVTIETYRLPQGEKRRPRPELGTEPEPDDVLAGRDTGIGAAAA